MSVREDHGVQRALIVSSDGHVGPPAERYRPYVEPRYRADFDQWLAAYVPLWLATRAKGRDLPQTWSEEYKRQWMEHQEEVPWGIEGKWDPHRRLEALNADGITADVLFPDDQSANSPPFIGLARDFNRPWDKEYPAALKLAGARAYNRWLAEFCAAAPERLLGIALIGTLADLDAAIEEVKWAKENGITGGVLLPIFYYNTEPFWNDRRYDPLWAACEELEMPLHTHVGPGSPYYGNEVEAPILYAMESLYWPHRPLWFFILGGVLERFPRLKLIFTEQGATWVIEALAHMDHSMTNPMFSYAEQGVLQHTPSEYFRRQCWIGATNVTRPELEMRHAIGVEKLMWGSDYPHLESQWPHTREKLHEVMKGFPAQEVLAMVGGNAVEAYELDLQRLAPVVEQVGPAVTEIVAAGSSFAEPTERFSGTRSLGTRGRCWQWSSSSIPSRARRSPRG